MDKRKTGLIMGGLALAALCGVGGYYLYVNMKESENVTGLGTPMYYGDWNTGQVGAYKRQQAMLLQQRQGIPQVF